MKKLIISGIVALSLVGGIASAQTYSYSSSNASYLGSACSIAGNLTIGSTGQQVRALQIFLVAQNYPGSGAWMETGYYGQATAAAVRIFQQQHGLSQTGSLNASTIAAIQGVSCGGSTYSYPGYPGTTYPSTIYPSTTYPYTTYPNTTYPYNNYPYTNGTPTITSLSQNTGTPGQSVTIYGQGFNPSFNTVYFNGQALSGVSSGNGTSISFTIPYTSSYSTNQTVNLYVANQGGTSNSVTFTLYASSNCNNVYGCSTCNTNTYPYTTGYNNCGCSNTYPYTSNCNTCGTVYNSYPYTTNCGNGQGNVNSPTITYLSPNSGAVGINVTVYGSGFTTSNNTVHFGNGVITGLGSADGQSISFIVPSQLTGFGSQPVTLGTYNVSVTNSNNITTSALPFTVTSTNGSGTGSPTITNVSGPNSLATNQQGTWTMSINTNGSSFTTVSAAWGDTGNGYVNMAAPQVVYNSQTVTFTHAYINPGTYTLTFTVGSSNGQSNTYTSTVVVSGNGTQTTGVPVISYLSPSSGYVGSQITVVGYNFSTIGSNTVYLGNGAIQNLYSNGSTITFTVPSYTTPYCTPGLLCGVQPTQVTPGTYNISVMDQYGTSNQVTFTVL